MTQFRPSRFQILPTIVKNLLIINGLVFLAQYSLASKVTISLEDSFALHTWQSPLFKPWQFITHMFMHGNFQHLLSNMFALWMFGSMLENVWGAKKFLFFYLICGLGAALCHMTVLYVETEHMIKAYNALTSARVSDFEIQNFLVKYPRTLGDNSLQEVFNSHLNEATVGASGAVFGCLAAFAYLFPNTEIYVYFLLPIKAKWFVLLYAAFELVAGISNSAGDNVAHFAHLGGALVGFILVFFWNKTNRKTFY
jgi:membrane associated rhomboid family serine protease